MILLFLGCCFVSTAEARVNFGVVTDALLCLLCLQIFSCLFSWLFFYNGKVIIRYNLQMLYFKILILFLSGYDIARQTMGFDNLRYDFTCFYMSAIYDCMLFLIWSWFLIFPCVFSFVYMSAICFIYVVLAIVELRNCLKC